jgi:hypothetical protein
MQRNRYLTETEVDKFLKIYIDSIPGIGESSNSLLAQHIKCEIREMEAPDLEEGMIGFMIQKHRYVCRFRTMVPPRTVLW